MTQQTRNRRSIRLPNFDYSSNGAYFITICSLERRHLFGKIAHGKMILSDLGFIVAEEWYRSAEIRQEIQLDEFVIMPNHIHGVVFIQKPEPSTPAGAQGLAPSQHDGRAITANTKMPIRKPKSLSTFVAGFKAACTKRINEYRQTLRAPVWQRNYYEHIIRSEKDLNNIHNYISNNPANWHQDNEYEP